MLLAASDSAASGAGPIGAVIIVLLAIVTVFLIRNMNARLKRMPRSFDPPPGEDEQPPRADDPRLDDPR